MIDDVLDIRTNRGGGSEPHVLGTSIWQMLSVKLTLETFHSWRLIIFSKIKNFLWGFDPCLNFFRPRIFPSSSSICWMFSRHSRVFLGIQNFFLTLIPYYVTMYVSTISLVYWENVGKMSKRWLISKTMFFFLNRSSRKTSVSLLISLVFYNSFRKTIQSKIFSMRKAVVKSPNENMTSV